MAPFGFSPDSYARHRPLEEAFLTLPRPENCQRHAKFLTSFPHVAGTEGDRRVVQYIFDRFREYGLDPEIVEYEVLLSYPAAVSVRIMNPAGGAAGRELAAPEPFVAGDTSTRPSRDPLVALPWVAYSPSARITAPVIYANYGNPEDYRELERLGVEVKGKLVLARYFKGYRGGKMLEAEKRGAAGVLVYSDPADDGYVQGDMYPQGPWGPPGHFQRGAAVYDFKVPGDPLTPGWASVPGARRIPEKDSQVLPRIPMVPLSARSGAEILRRLTGAPVPSGWQGGLPFTYHVGEGKPPELALQRRPQRLVRIFLHVGNRREVKKIWNVVARITGTEEAEKTILLSNHHDAWVYGAVDPMSGTATMLELARALGELRRRGWRPRRTIILGNWDAEEFTLTGSTEWGEQHAVELRRNAVACLNVDASASGPRLAMTGTPSLRRFAIEAAAAVPDPAGTTLLESWKKREPRDPLRTYGAAGVLTREAPIRILGSGSDYTVFFNHLGVPTLDMSFDGPYGVYHSIYDNFSWMSRFGDPGFRYHAAMAQLWGLMALRLAQADLLPFDFTDYADDLRAYLADLKFLDASQAGRLEGKIAAMKSAATALSATMKDPPACAGAAAANARLLSAERGFLHEAGIPGRLWFRHLIYAPLPSYAAQTLPGIREALERNDHRVVAEQVTALEGAIETVTGKIHGALESCRRPVPAPGAVAAKGASLDEAGRLQSRQGASAWMSPASASALVLARQ